MTRKFLREMLLDAKKQHLKAWEDAARLQEARSKEQQIRGQQAMLDQKIKAEYDKLTKDVPPPSERRKKKEVTGTGASPYQVYKPKTSGNYVPAPKRTTEELTLKSFDDFMVEGMTSKDFKDIYGGYVVTSIMSQSPELTGDETAQNILKHSANATNYAFGVNFPGSYINSIGDFDKPESLSFADINAMAVPTPAGDAIAWNPFNQTLPTNYQLGNSAPASSSVQQSSSALDNAATIMVSRGETTDTHTDIYYTPNISQTDDTITLKSGTSADYQDLSIYDFMRITGLHVGNNVTKPNNMYTDLRGASPGDPEHPDQQFVVPNLLPAPYGYDTEPPDPVYPDENEDGGEPMYVTPMLRTYNNKSAGDQITFEWEFNAGNNNVNNPNNEIGVASYDASAWVYINGDNTYYKLANIYDHDTLRIGDDAFYSDTVGGHYDEYGDPVGFDDGDTRQQDNAGALDIRPEFKSGGSGRINGSFAYTVKSSDIDSNGNFKMWFFTTMANNETDNLRIIGLTGEKPTPKSKKDAGQLGKTSDAYGLGYRVYTPSELKKLLKGLDIDKFKIGVGNTNLTAGELKKVLEKSPQIANAAEKIGTQGKTFLDYLTGNLPDTIDNEYLGQEYVNSIFKDADINSDGTISVGDNIVGTGGKATYDATTGEVSIPFNYDFKKNTDEFKDPSKAGIKDFQKAILNAVGPYSADAQPNLPGPLAPLQAAAGIIFGGAIAASKALGGAKHRPGKVTMSASELEKINPALHAQIVGLGEDYKNLPRDRMEKQYDRKKDKNYDEFHKQNPMGIGPRVSRGKSDTQIDQHGNSRQTKAISGQLKNNPRFYDSSHEQWQRMQSKFKSRKNSDATGEVARRLNPKSYGEEYKKFPFDKVERKLKKVVDSIEKNPKDLGFKNTLKKKRIGNLKAELSTDERERESQSKFISKINSDATGELNPRKKKKL